MIFRLSSLLIFVSIFVFLLTGCASKEERTAPQEFDAVSPEVAGTAVPQGSLASVRSEGHVRVYHKGRYVDPANPNIMHEAGEMYVLTDSGAWNLSPNNSPLSPEFNRVITVSEPLDAARSLEIMQLVKTNELMMELGKALADTRNEMLRERTQGKQKNAEHQKTLDAISSRLKELEKANIQIMRKMSEMEIKINSRPRRAFPSTPNKGE